MRVQHIHKPPVRATRLRIIAALLLATSLSSFALIPPGQVLESPLCQVDTLNINPNPNPKATQLAPHAIQVLSWNVWKQRHPALHADLAAMVPRADLVLLQEADISAPPAPALGAFARAAFAAGYTTRALHSGVLTLGRVAPAAHCRLSHLEPWLRTPKATSLARFPLGAGNPDLLVVNMHGINFSLGTGATQQQLAAVGEWVRKHQGPVLFAGDFNTWSGPRQAALRRAAQQLGLSAVAFAEDHRAKKLGRAVDHILVRGLTVIASQVLEVQSSDHNPLLATLCLPSPTLSPSTREDSKPCE